MLLSNYVLKIKFRYNINTIVNIKKLLTYTQQLNFLRLKLFEIFIVYSENFAEKKLYK